MGCGGGGEKKKKKSKRIYRTGQNIRIIIINAFLESLLAVRVLSLTGSQSPPHPRRMPSNVVQISEPFVGAVQILI